MEIPPFMLKKLYQKGSLKNTAEGVMLAVKNSISPATVNGLDQLVIGEHTCDMKQVVLQAGDHTVTADEITPDQPLQVKWNQAIKMVVKDLVLEAGTYKIVITINTRDVGPLTLEVSDSLAE